MDVLNIYTQRIPRNTVKALQPSPPPILTQPPLPAVITHQSSQTAISCPPFKTVSMQHRSQMRAASSQTEVVRQSESVETATQTADNLPPLVPTLPATIPHTTADVKTEAVVNTVQVPADSYSGGSGGAEEQRSKHVLLQRLRELDGQTPAPSSKPIPPVKTTGAASALAVATTLTHHTPTAPLPSGVNSSMSHSEATDSAANAASERGRRQLLLARLMAIDEGNNPEHVKSTPQNPQRHASPRGQEVANSPHGITANKTSSSSLSSWPEVIENMHHGRPAYASEHDPFGSKSRLSSLKRGDRGGRRETRGGGSGKERRVISDLVPQPVPGRWGLDGERTPPTDQQLAKKDNQYKPSFGRRAHTRSDQPPNDPHPPQERKSSDSSLLSPSISTGRGGLLPRRPKADAGAMRSHDVMPGAVVSEPDDLEELVL